MLSYISIIEQVSTAWVQCFKPQRPLRRQPLGTFGKCIPTALVDMRLAWRVIYYMSKDSDLTKPAFPRGIGLIG